MGLFKRLLALFSRSVVVTCHDEAFVYDGTAHKLTYSVSGLPAGYTIDINPKWSPIDVASNPYLMHAESVVIRSKSGRDLTHRFHICTPSGSVRVLPAPLTLSSGSASKVWDGTELSCDSISYEGLCGRDVVVAHAVGALSRAGHIENSIHIDWNASSAKHSNYDVELHPGVLHVHPAPMKAVGRSIQVVYDGKPHCFEVDAPQGAQVAFEGKAEFTDAGSYSIRFAASLQNHVTAEGEAHLKIAPTSLVVTGSSARKEFDGAPLSDDAVFVEGLVTGESLCAHATGRAVGVGVTENPVIIDWESSTAKQENYQVEVLPGKLEVVRGKFEARGIDKRVTYNGTNFEYEVEAPDGARIEFEDDEPHFRVGAYSTRFRASMNNYEDVEGCARLTISEASDPIVVKTEGGEFTYDGNEHGGTVIAPSLPEGYTLVEASSSARVRDVAEGECIATCDVLRIENCSGEDVAEKLDVIYDDGMIRIVPKKLAVITFDASRPYDGRPLCAGGKLLGLCPGETVSFKAVGAQIEVGESENTYRLDFDGTAKRDNYVIKESLGCLRVLPAAEEEEPGGQGVEPAKGGEVQKPEVPEHLQSMHAVEDMTDNKYAGIPWQKPEVRTLPTRGGGAVGKQRVRAFSARPVVDRADLEEAGLGRGFNPFPNLSMRNLNKTALERTLRGLDLSARDAIDQLLDRNPKGLLFECFPDFAGDLMTLRDSFEELMQSFSYDKRYALVWIHCKCSSAFLLYVAFLANSSFDGESLWDKLFREMGVREQEVKTAVKRMFISYLFRRGMVVYERNSTHTYFADTAILHGGLSEGTWKDLWTHSFLPLAKSGCLSDNYDDARVLELILNDESYRPRAKRTKDLLSKISTEVLAPYCGAALKIARRVVAADKVTSLIPFQGLPDVALRALEEVLAKDASRSRTKTEESTVLFVGQISLELDLASGVVRFSWSSDRLPAVARDLKVEYLVDGVLEKRVDILPLAGACQLPAGHIEIRPRERYDIERRVVASGPDGSFREVASLSQSFRNSKPGCFEFVRNREDVYKFRGADQRLLKKSRIAYLVEKGRVVEARHGMSLVNIRPGGGDWADMTVYEFDVEPGASGLILDEVTGEVLSGWHEDYRVRIDKGQAIGSAGGLDLYGHVLGSGETDVALPSIRIDALGSEAVDDVEVRFIKNGESSRLRARWQISESDNTAALFLSFPSAAEGRGIVRSCVIEARQGTTEDILLRYRFAIVPIQGFRLEDYKIDAGNGELIGIYQFEVTEPLTIRYVDGNDEVEQLETGTQSNLQAPLSSEVAQAEMTDHNGTSINVQLNLAGITVKASEALLSSGRGGSCISYPSISRLGFTNGDISISGHGTRHGRHVSMRLGSVEILDKRLDHAGTTLVNIFSDKRMFEPSEGAVSRPLPLIISISYGYRMNQGMLEPATADYQYLNCEQGIGFSSCGVRLVGGKYCLRFGGSGGDVPSSRLRVTFLTRTGKELASTDVEPGESVVELPVEVTELYKSRKILVVRISPKSRFGAVEKDCFVELSECRGSVGR